MSGSDDAHARRVRCQATQFVERHALRQRDEDEDHADGDACHEPGHERGEKPVRDIDAGVGGCRRWPESDGRKRSRSQKTADRTSRPTTSETTVGERSMADL